MKFRSLRSSIAPASRTIRAIAGRGVGQDLLAPPRSGGALRVAAVWARDYETARPAGRVNICRFRRRCLDSRYTTLNLVVPSVLTNGVAGLLPLVRPAVRALARGDRSLQSLLFANRPAIQAAIAALARFRPDVLLVDSVRLLDLVLAVREAFPGLRIVLDMDDLLSRRMAAWLEAGQGVGLGYLQDSLPPWVGSLLGLDWIGRRLIGHEEAALAREEIELCARVDTVVLISEQEAGLLDARLAEHTEIVPPIVAAVGPPWRAEREVAALEGPLRFVFVGSDRLLQNRATIDQLVRLWATLRPAHPFVVYGEQSRPPKELPPGVELRGWAFDLDSVYDGRSILLAPAFVRGGIKTKILEALAYGCPTIGNATAYEGIVASPPALGFESPELPRLLAEPEAFRARLVAQTKALRHEVARRFAEPLVVDALDRLLDPRPALHLVPQSA